MDTLRRPMALAEPAREIAGEQAISAAVLTETLRLVRSSDQLDNVLVGSTPYARRPLIPLVTAGAAIGILAATSELPVAVAACFVVGGSILTSEVLVTSALSRSLQGSLVAPAFGVLDGLMVAAMIAGAVVAPLLTASFGLRPALAIAGIGTPLLAVCSLRPRPGRQASVVEPPADRLRSPSGPPVGEVAYVRLTAGRGDGHPRR
jgi:hypothetical protein